MTCQGLVNGNIAWKLPHCGSCTLDDAILVCLIALCWGRVSSAPTGGAGAQASQGSAVWLFLFPQLVGALSTSALRAERRKRGPKTRLSISISTCARPAPKYTEKFSPISARSTADSEKGEHQKVRVSKKLGKDQVDEASDDNGQRALLPFLLYQSWMTVSGVVCFSLLCCLCLVKLSHWLFTQRRADLIVYGLLGFAAQMVLFYN